MFTQIFGDDYLSCGYDKDKGTSIDETILSTLVDYNHNQWESGYLNQQTAACARKPSKGYGPKQLTFLPTSHEAPIKSNGSEISQEDVVILDEGGDSDYKEPNSLSNRIEQQLSTAISSASIRAEIAALATLISPVSSASGYMCT